MAAAENAGMSAGLKGSVMETGFFVVPVLAVVAAGWIAGLGLLPYWVQRRNRGPQNAVWRRIWGVGWLCFGVSYLLGFDKRGIPTIEMLAVFLVPLGPIFWLLALFLFRKSNPAVLKTPAVNDDEARKGVWPPPPNVPK